MDRADGFFLYRPTRVYSLSALLWLTIGCCDPVATLPSSLPNLMLRIFVTAMLMFRPGPTSHN
jgi:hypothetical protein